MGYFVCWNCFCNFSSVRWLSPVQLCDSMDCSTPSFTVYHQLWELVKTHVRWVGNTSNHLFLCCPLLLLSSNFPIRDFSNESVFCIRWPNDWSLRFSISPSNEYSELISFRMDWLDLLAVQVSIVFSNTTVQKASNLQCSAFFIVQLSHPCMTTGKIIALTRQTSLAK